MKHERGESDTVGRWSSSSSSASSACTIGPLCPSAFATSSLSWISISVLRAHRISRYGAPSQDELAHKLASVASSFYQAGLVKSAVLKSLTNKNQVAMFSVWQGCTCSDNDIEHSFKASESMKKRHIIGSFCTRQTSSHPPATVPFMQAYAYKKAISSIAHITELAWYEVLYWDSLYKDPCPFLHYGDIVHLRGITGQPDNKDVLSYSCLAILRAYFHHTEGLLSHTFYRSKSGLAMAGLGVWKSFEAAAAYLHAHDGAPEESYWRSLGAKWRLGIYSVEFVTEGYEEDCASTSPICSK